MRSTTTGPRAPGPAVNIDKEQCCSNASAWSLDGPDWFGVAHPSFYLVAAEFFHSCAHCGPSDGHLYLIRDGVKSQRYRAASMIAGVSVGSSPLEEFTIADIDHADFEAHAAVVGISRD